MFLSPLMPFAPILSTIGLLLNYIIDKYSLLNKCKRPLYLNSELALYIIVLIGFGWVNYVLGNLIFTFNFENYENSSDVKLFILVFITFMGFFIENIVSEINIGADFTKTDKK